ncbi:MAG: heterodisulfide reductase-related iron-sulfur binding cluster, partial [Acidobacteriota bacterium]
GLGSRRLYEVLDLCLECKGCKAECPSGVDLAKLKYEFLAQYQAVHGTPLRSRLFGRIDTLSRWGSATAPLSNLVGGLPPVRWLQDRLLGITARRPLPRFARPTFRQRFESRSRRPGDRGPVVIFDDTFMNHNHPEVGIAAVRVLEAAGYEPMLAAAGCCGRPMLSKGLVEQARARARDNVEALDPWLQSGVPVVGCEPSCLLMLRGDYRYLIPDDGRLDALEEGTWMIEEFLLDAARRSGRERLGLSLQPRPRRILVHGHCHQKAAVGVEPTVELLGWVPGQETVGLDTGCCGMAGSFGFEAEHYELSMQIGELALFPAVRAAPEAGVSTAGISCRQQVRHGTGREPRHPVEWLADALE